MASQHSPPPPETGAPAVGAAGADRPSARQALLAGRKLRKLRKDRRLDQAELAALVGLQPADVAGIEKGEYRISLDVLFRLLHRGGGWRGVRPPVTFPGAGPLACRPLRRRFDRISPEPSPEGEQT